MQRDSTQGTDRHGRPVEGTFYCLSQEAPSVHLSHSDGHAHIPAPATVRKTLDSSLGRVPNFRVENVIILIGAKCPALVHAALVRRVRPCDKTGLPARASLGNFLEKRSLHSVSRVL